MTLREGMRELTPPEIGVTTQLLALLKCVDSTINKHFKVILSKSQGSRYPLARYDYTLPN
jgi:hypothetical protein